MTPFLKWVGGKQRILHHLLPILEQRPNPTLVEPFVGGGSIFMTYRKYFKHIMINDRNPALVNCYVTLRDRFESFWNIYNRLCICYLQHPNKEVFYYNIRDIFNTEQDGPNAAACLIVLNKTCYNGLFRVNSTGAFNTSWGKYVCPAFPTRKELLMVSEGLQGVAIRNEDFRALDYDANSFVYFDPPYYPTGGNFTSYTTDGFTLQDHVDLKNLVLELDQAQTPFALSNSNFHNIRLWFPHDWIRYVSISRCLAQDSDLRYAESEVIISNRW